MWLPKTGGEVYIEYEIYAVLRSELAVQFLRIGHHDPNTEAVHVLGEIRGIWPKSVLDEGEAG